MHRQPQTTGRQESSYTDIYYFTMQQIGSLDYSLALVAFVFGVVYLSLGLAIKRSPKGNRLAAFNDGTSFLNGKFFVYLFSSSGFMVSFFIARLRSDHQLLIFVMFNVSHASHSLCISAELVSFPAPQKSLILISPSVIFLSKSILSGAFADTFRWPAYICSWLLLFWFLEYGVTWRRTDNGFGFSCQPMPL